MERRAVTTSDGVRLSYLVGGTGQPIVMVPGWSQTATSFENQFAALCSVSRVIALDMRGHGESEKPDHGYRVQRLAKDLFDVIEALNLDQPDLLGHSMGAAVIWSYLSLFRAERPARKLIFVDEGAALMARPDWNEGKRAQAGCVFPSMDALARAKQQILAADAPETAAEILRPMFSDAIDERTLMWVAGENLKLPRHHAIRLLEDNVIQDWSELIATIEQPVLAIGGGDSHIGTDSQRWIADTVSNGRIEVIPGGRHFMFFEEFERFNAAITSFLGE
ncbi:MAG: alpha/beta hydrolase [Pseudomonadota bacterium]